MNLEVEKYQGELKNKRLEAMAFNDIIQFLAENYSEELLEEIGEEKCIEYFKIKVHHEEEW